MSGRTRALAPLLAAMLATSSAARLLGDLHRQTPAIAGPRRARRLHGVAGPALRRHLRRRSGNHRERRAGGRALQQRGVRLHRQVGAAAAGARRHRLLRVRDLGTRRGERMPAASRVSPRLQSCPRPRFGRSRSGQRDGRELALRHGRRAVGRRAQRAVSGRAAAGAHGAGRAGVGLQRDCADGWRFVALPDGRVGYLRDADVRLEPLPVPVTPVSPAPVVPVAPAPVPVSPAPVPVSP